MSKVITIVSGKGGTGKTVVCSNLGASLALKGHSVCLVDMDRGLRNLDLYMGLESRVVYDVQDVLLGLCRIKQALIRDKRFRELYIIAAPQYRKEDDITDLHMKVLCEKLSERFEYIIIDSPAGTDEDFKLAVAAADEVVIVTTPEYAAVRDADAVDRILEELGKKKRAYIINKLNADLLKTGLVPTLSDVANMLRIELLGIIQDDENIHVAAAKGIPIVLKRDSYISRNFEQISERLI